MLSQLFSQALVSGECVLYESDFREKVNGHLPHLPLASPKAKSKPTDYTVCIAIMIRVAGPLGIPFFSTVSLRHAVTALRRMQYKVTKLNIDR
jgi:uncharacterized protein (TIGR04141 family)